MRQTRLQPPGQPLVAKRAERAVVKGAAAAGVDNVAGKTIDHLWLLELKRGRQCSKPCLTTLLVMLESVRMLVNRHGG
ncbi:hypothetical protein BDI4_340033 [Burkholderia diffusa]|nr:hypothetical protein BDI4_340033 [Burkholderia diffusa]